MNKALFYTATLLSFSMMACNSQNESKTEAIAVDTQVNQKKNDMKSHLSRAVDFYQAILGIPIEKMEMPGMEMGVFPYEEQMVTGVIMKGEGYNPSADGLTLYLNGGDNLQNILGKVEGNGGKIIVPKTAHADDSGFFALFLDTEGNKLGLHSPN